MITKQQAIAMHHGQELHANGCTRTVGPRGGVKVKIETWRVSGKCQVWKTRPDEFRLPIKFGLYGYDAVTERNCGEVHLASECPLLTAETEVQS